MTETAKPMDELTALLEERARDQGWLAQLEHKRERTPAHVFERVRGDYTGRLDGVNERLGARASELEATAASLAERVARLFDEETTRRDERAEAELRAEVGEFEDEQALEVISRCDAEIERLATEREALGSELATLQGVLAQVATPAPAPEPPQAAAEPEEVLVPVESLAPDHADEPEIQVTMAEDTPAARVAPRAATPAETASFDELAFLQSVVEPRSSSPVGVAAVPVEERAAEATEELVPPPVLSAVRRPSVPTPVTSPALEAQMNGSGRGKLTPGTLPAFMKDMTTEQIKTLKCQECGTMNYPTEWYCERCGGALAAL